MLLFFNDNPSAHLVSALLRHNALFELSIGNEPFVKLCSTDSHLCLRPIVRVLIDKYVVQLIFVQPLVSNNIRLRAIDQPTPLNKLVAGLSR